MNRVRKPESQRGPQLARRAKAIEPGIRTRPRGTPAPGPRRCAAPLRKPMDSSPWLESTRAGSRIARIVATTKTRNA